jgi:CelD/BcsL family acetyltransferase involved in cellulose biosynthesis
MCDAGGYEPQFLMLRDGGIVKGLLPLLLVRSRLTGTRLVCLPFSDACYPLSDGPGEGEALLRGALDLARIKQVDYLEIRGAPCTKAATGKESRVDLIEKLGYSGEYHFKNYIVHLTKDTEAIKGTFQAKMRQLINKSFREGVRVRVGTGEKDIDEFYRLYLLNRRYHGIPPQPRGVFSRLFSTLTDEPRALLYLAGFQGANVAGIVALRFKGICYGKYEGVDHAFRKALPIHALLWKLIEDAANDGETAFDFGRTAADNTGLNEFKDRWGSTCIDLPYYFHPPRQGLSIVKANSLKYRLFTGLVKRLPLSVNARIGARLFRHFG